MEQTSETVPLAGRIRVVRAAFFFVPGFTLVFTASGALIGWSAARLGESIDFDQWQRYMRYIGIVGGIIILVMALRVAAKVRAPLVCKMPILSKMSNQKRPAKPWELMLAGLAFATGCMTCFGAATVTAMVVYVGVSGSAAFGAFALFLFSLGMGIPLIIAASVMAKFLPVLFKLEKGIRWLGMASSLVMIGFAVLLITGNYVTLTEWAFGSFYGLGSS